MNWTIEFRENGERSKESEDAILALLDKKGHFDAEVAAFVFQYMEGAASCGYAPSVTIRWTGEQPWTYRASWSI